jgi:DNA/RNA-binding domain of Phe-tRNA-synthetase-like protein
MEISIDPHPLLDAVILHTIWPTTLDQVPSLSDLDGWFSEGAQPPMDRPEEVKSIIRDLLRHGGFKPSGRSKPASEYLVGAAAKGRMGSINAAVDCCNVASLHSGLPISVVDMDRGVGPWRIGLVPPNTEYVFNPAGQVIGIGGLLSLFDGDGPCGGPVKDSQRTKTHEKTHQTLSVVWGSTALPGRSHATAEWYASLMDGLGARVQRLRPTAP